jgi:hypothetical protein
MSENSQEMNLEQFIGRLPNCAEATKEFRALLERMRVLSTDIPPGIALNNLAKTLTVNETQEEVDALRARVAELEAEQTRLIESAYAVTYWAAKSEAVRVAVWQYIKVTQRRRASMLEVQEARLAMTRALFACPSLGTMTDDSIKEDTQ